MGLGSYRDVLNAFVRLPPCATNGFLASTELHLVGRVRVTSQIANASPVHRLFCETPATASHVSE